MSRLLGEFECKLDGKGRLIIPSKLKKQLPPDAQDALIINRSFEKCLVIFTKQDWEKETDLLSDLNKFNMQHRKFMRLFNNGAQEIGIDAQDRILIPKKLLEHAEIHTDVVLFAYDNRIEIWSQKVYNEELNMSPEDYAALAEEVMGNNKPHRPGGIV